MTLSIEFWGVRGSIPSPGFATARTGGNTSCVSVRCGASLLILDGGTGLRQLGDSLEQSPAAHLTILLSHLHWDHIQGLPFFVPLYSPNRQVEILGPSGSPQGVRKVLAQQMNSPVFPVEFDRLPALLGIREMVADTALPLGGAEVRAVKVNHPGGAFAYRIDYEGSSVVYATDVEAGAAVDPSLLALAKGADVLIHDAQYTPEELPRRVGWGHSTYDAATQLACAADVGSLVLFHHDPRRTDEEVDAIELRAQCSFEGTRAAREGLRLELGSPQAHAA